MDIESITEQASVSPAIPATFDAVVTDIQSNEPGTYEKKDITVGGLNGIEYIQTDTGSSGEKWIYVYFAKGDKLYEFFLTTTDLNADKPGFDMMINSMKIQ